MFIVNLLQILLLAYMFWSFGTPYTYTHTRSLSDFYVNFSVSFFIHTKREKIAFFIPYLDFFLIENHLITSDL